MEQERSTSGESRSSTGLDPGLGGLLAYLVPPISGLVLVLLEKRDEVIRWHAAQSIVFGIGLFVIGVVCQAGFIALVMLTAFAAEVGGYEPVGFFLFPLLWAGYLLVGVALWVVCLVKGASGGAWRFPGVADLAERVVPMPGKEDAAGGTPPRSSP